MKSRFSISTVLFAGVLALAGCDDSQPVQQIQTPPAVSVATVINERLTEWDEFTGRIQAPQTVDLRPRVSGYIDFVAFEEGSLVEAGDPLFFIDNRQFKAEVKRLTAELTDVKAQFELAKREYVRAQNLAKDNAISEEVLDNRLTRQRQAQAAVESVSAALELAKLDLSYTRVTAPISGRVSNALITKGNYVTAGDSVLTTLVSTHQVFAYFDADEQTYLKYTQLAKQGARPSSRDVENPVQMGLANDEGFPHEGVIDFVDNRVNIRTGTIRGRAVFDNSDGSLIPGLFARIRLIGSASYDGLLIDDKAIGTDLNNKFVLVLDDQNTVQYRRVTLGEKVGGLRIVKDGLQPGETIVVNGLQRVRPGSPVTPQNVAMASEEQIDSLQAMQRRVDESRSLDGLASLQSSVSSDKASGGK